MAELDRLMAVDGVTIVSVAYDNTPLLRQNATFVGYFNSNRVPRWVVVDNSTQVGTRPDLPPSMEVVHGVEKKRTGDRGSLHHARGLEEGLKHVRTRFVLFMDADFFVIRQQWIEELYRHIIRCHLAVFGSVWHPSWSYQYRYFPSVHFLWIDGEQLPFDGIDLKPQIDADRWWRLINDERLPIPFRHTLKATRIRDTGWPLYRRVHGDPTFGRECLVPHFVPDDSRRYRFETALRWLLPESVCLYPKEESWQTARTFLRDRFPEAYDAGWEEFFWRGEPFAFHLRQVGRRMRGHATGTDLQAVARVFASYRTEAPT